MLKLLLLRHAKSSWDNLDHSDHQRPLSPRGLKAAPEMGKYIVKQGIIPELVLSSTATRARQTTQLASGKFKRQVETRFLDDLYNFSGFHTPLNIIRDQGDQQSPLMVVGHNPTMEILAAELTGAGNSAARALMHEKYPTAALAVIDFDIPRWADLQTGIGTLVQFIRPRDL